MCPLNIRLLPPPAPSRIPSAFARPSSTCCHWQRRPSLLVERGHQLGHVLLVAGEAPYATIRLAVSTRRSRSTEIDGGSTFIGEAILGAEVRQHVRSRTGGSARADRRPRARA